MSTVLTKANAIEYKEMDIFAINNWLWLNKKWRKQLERDKKFYGFCSCESLLEYEKYVETAM